MSAATTGASARSKNVLLKVTGSIAAFKAAALASKLVQAGYSVRTVLSSGAAEFVGAATLEGLTGHPVYRSTFAAGEAMAHIDLAKWADLTLVYPASANTLTKLGAGRADDLIGTLFLAHGFRTPYWVVPAMNPAMLAHPAVAEAVAKLRGWGVEVLDADAGRMACGDVGAGRLVEPEAMLAKIESFFADSTKTAPGPAATSAILVTAGGTSESIDPVRVLTNVSTGETGVRIANALAARASVTLLLAENSPFRASVAPNVRVRAFREFADLDAAMREELSRPEYGTLVHAAAVSDYRIERIENTAGETLDAAKKIGSQSGLVLRLAPNPKILARVREYAKNPRLRVVSFKLATPAVGETADLSGYDSDVIVHNRADEIERGNALVSGGRGSSRHLGEVFARRDGAYVSVARFATKDELVAAVAAATFGEIPAPGPAPRELARASLAGPAL